MHRRLFILFLLLLSGTAVSHSAAQTNYRLRLSTPDLSQFPTVRVNVQTGDANGVPAADLDGLRVQEDGQPIRDFTQTIVPVGVDIIFVLDANDAMLTADAGGETQYAQVDASIRRFAERFMSPSGRDRVSMIAPQPDGASGELLLSGGAEPAAVYAALDAYAPTSGTAVPLNRMMVLALTEARRLQTDNRFQAILLFSDGGGLDAQIEDGVIAQAQRQQAGLFVAIVGAQMTLDELENGQRLALPTRGDVVHMPQPAAADAFYLVWQRQANQTQVSYQSALRTSGDYPLTVTFGPDSAATTIPLSLLPPQPALLPESSVITRRGETPDAPLTALAPQTASIPVQVQFPDGIQRPLTALSLLVNGRPADTITLPADSAAPAALDWDVRSSDTGAYELAVSVTDSFGLTAVSEPLLMTIVTERPSPVTPTPLPPTPTAETLPALPPLPRLPDWLQREWVLMLGIGAVALLAAWLLWRGLRRTAPLPAPTRQQALPVQPPKEGAAPVQLMLNWTARGPATPTLIAAEHVLVGRDATRTQLTLTDASVSPLHARIRRRDGRFWLYDEGSGGGTFLNHERLALAPRPLQDGDHIRFGRVTCTVQLRNTPSAE